MEISTRVERDRYQLHRTNPIAYHASKIHWDFFGTLTFRVVPPDYVQHRCIFELIRRSLKEFHSSQDVRWSTHWMFRKEVGRKGRQHWHFLKSLDKTYSNRIATAEHLESLWEKSVASRQVARYNKEAENHNRALRRKLRYKSPDVRQELYEASCRSYIRNDYSAPGYADIRVFDPNENGVDYILKDEGNSISGANAYELSKFGSSSNDDLLISHRTLYQLFRRIRGRKTKKKELRLFQQMLVDSAKPSRQTRPQGEFRKAPDTSRQMWDPHPEFKDAEEPWFKSQY